MTYDLPRFAQTLVDAGVIPPLTYDQEIFLEALNGDRYATRPRLADAARRGGRRHLRAIVAAYYLSIGETVTFASATAVQAERARQDALDVLDDLERTRQAAA